MIKTFPVRFTEEFNALLDNAVKISDCTSKNKFIMEAIQEKIEKTMKGEK